MSLKKLITSALETLGATLALYTMFLTGPITAALIMSIYGGYPDEVCKGMIAGGAASLVGVFFIILITDAKMIFSSGKLETE